MLQHIEFKNYRVLRSATLPLSPCTLLLGPNGSGKSTAIRALELMAKMVDWKLHPKNPHVDPQNLNKLTEFSQSIGTAENTSTEIKLVYTEEESQFHFDLKIVGNRPDVDCDERSRSPSPENKKKASAWLNGIRSFSLDPSKIAQPARLEPNATINSDGSRLSVVLTQLQDKHPERFDELNKELSLWLPEFDRVLFDITPSGERTLLLRTKNGRHPIRAGDLSDGTLFLLCIMSLAHSPDPPTCVCLEEPDRGIHPRLLRQVHDAMVRLSNPSAMGDSRKPVQVIATSHSPYFLDLFRDHPQDVVLAEKTENGATFHRLTDMPNYKEIMHDTQLSDAWYTGILGGVPASP